MYEQMLLMFSNYKYSVKTGTLFITYWQHWQHLTFNDNFDPVNIWLCAHCLVQLIMSLLVSC